MIGYWIKRSVMFALLPLMLAPFAGQGHAQPEQPVTHLTHTSDRSGKRSSGWSCLRHGAATARGAGVPPRRGYPAARFTRIGDRQEGANGIVRTAWVRSAAGTRVTGGTAAGEGYQHVRAGSGGGISVQMREAGDLPQGGRPPGIPRDAFF